MEAVYGKEYLDIILITYNRCKKLDETLRIILGETSPIKDFYITIIDNNSTDSTESVVRKYQADFPNLAYEKNKYNIGGNANIMKAFYKAEKKYIWVLADNDEYCWNSWHEVEEAMNRDKDAIVVSTYECPSYNKAQLFIQASFLPGVIYKTSLIDDVVMGNMAFNISNMFPHLALAAKLFNEDKDIYIVQDWIVNLGDNKDGTTGKYSYTRGYDESEIHPFMKNMNWLAGYANSIPLIKDKKLRNFIVTHNRFVFAPLNSARVFFYNSDESNNSLYNLLCIFCVLSFLGKLKFILYWILYYTLFSVVYIYTKYKRPECERQDYLIKRYQIRLFRVLKTKLFQIKVRNKRI